MSFGRRNFARPTMPAAARRPLKMALTLQPIERRVVYELMAILATLALLGIGLLFQTAFAGEATPALWRPNRLEFYLIVFGLAAPWLLIRQLFGLPALSRQRNSDTTLDGNADWFDGCGGADAGGCD